MFLRSTVWALIFKGRGPDCALGKWFHQIKKVEISFQYCFDLKLI